MKKYGIEEFIKKAQEIHKGECLDYSQVVYKNNKTPVKIIDPIYGEFWQSPSNHLKGHKHPARKNESISKTKREKLDSILKRFKNAHPKENLDYSKVKYVNMHTKVCIIDHDLKDDGTEYGEYWQEPCVHIKGCGHPLKGIKKSSDDSRMTTEEFIQKAKLIYGNEKYSYDKVDYKGYQEKVYIKCNKEGHGYFWITPDNFLHGKGCQKCGKQLSKGEEEIYNHIIKLFPNAIHNDRKVLDGDEIDILIPELKIGIEYNGLRWHSEKFKDKNYHYNKTLLASKKGFRLIQIYEDEYLFHKDIVLKKIEHILGISSDISKIMGRKTEINEINKNDAKIFLEKNHIQGFVNSTIYIGAFYNKKLIAVMSFKKEREKWELTRFASDINYICQGVGGKIFKYFVRNYNPTEIKSFADRRWTLNEENLYTKLGFKFNEYTKPDYTYIVKGERKHKFGFRKNILHKKYSFPMTMTETEMAKELGYDRIWNCGLIKYVWKRN